MAVIKTTTMYISENLFNRKIEPYLNEMEIVESDKTSLNERYYLEGNQEITVSPTKSNHSKLKLEIKVADSKILKDIYNLRRN